MLSEARKAIHRCEESLRALMAEASAAGKYDEVDTIMDWARMLNDLVTECSSDSTPPAPPAVGVPASRRSSAKKRNGKRRTKDYPRFLRSRDDLLKLGWSKKEKKEYQHRAPWSVVESLCRSIMADTSDNFTSEDVLPLVGTDGDEIPSYQSYLCIAWLRDSGLLVKEGRQGYHVPNRTELLSKATETWQHLPRKR